MQTQTTEPTTTAVPQSAVEKAEARVAKAKEAAERALAKAKEAQAKAEQRLLETEGKDERTARAKALVHEVVQVESDRRRCLCGCGANTPRAFFVPGHDARLLATTVRELLTEENG